MSDAVVLLVVAVLAAVVGIGAGILVARPIDRAMQRADEPEGQADADEATPIRAPGATEATEEHEGEA